MADQKLRDLTESTTPVSTDLAYLVVDPGGTPLDRKVEVGTLLGNLGAWCNLAKNSPGQIVTDGAEPQWWDDVANATLTDEDAVGEAIPDKTERVFKVVATANDVYGYQTYTFADESLLDAGQTVISASCWVYCASANKASIGLYGTNMGLTESDQHTGDGTWQLLKVENLTLNAADTSIQLRLIVDTDTAYFTMPMLNVGSCVLPWRPRDIKYTHLRSQATQFDLNTTGDVAWSNTDCTANTDPLAVGVQLVLYCFELNGSAGSYLKVAAPSALTAADVTWAIAIVSVVSVPAFESVGYLPCDDGQVIRYTVEEIDADSDVRAIVWITGYWHWAP